MAKTKKFIHKLTKQSKYTYYIVMPAQILDSLGWLEHQKLTIRKYGKGILIKDWKK